MAEQRDRRDTDECDIQFEQRSHRSPEVEFGLPPDESAGREQCLDDGAGVAQDADNRQGGHQCGRTLTPRKPLPPTRKKAHGPSLRGSFRITCCAQLDLLDYRRGAASLESPRWGVFRHLTACLSAGGRMAGH